MTLAIEPHGLHVVLRHWRGIGLLVHPHDDDDLPDPLSGLNPPLGYAGLEKALTRLRTLGMKAMEDDDGYWGMLTWGYLADGRAVTILAGIDDHGRVPGNPEEWAELEEAVSAVPQTHPRPSRAAA